MYNEKESRYEIKIPESEYKNQLSEFGLIKKEKIQKINTEILYNSYKKYEKEINKIELNKDIQIINSFENSKRENSKINLENESKYENEKEIKENIEITIDGKYIDFSYNYKFRRRKS